MEGGWFFVGGLVVGVVGGLVVGVLIGVYWAKSKDTMKEQLSKAVTVLENAQEKAVETVLEKSQEQAKRNRDALLQLADVKLGETLETAKGEIDKKHELFQQMVKPLSRNYGKLDQQIEELTTHVHSLDGALRGDNRRVGNWGEVQLKRVVEIAGLVEYCDFDTQPTAGDSTGYRPDLVVKLPDNRAIVIDAKASTGKFLDSQETVDEEDAKAKEKAHASALKRQVDDLSRKNYGERISGSLNFVVMFVPGDPFLATALRADDKLIDYGMQKRVAIATPASLIALLWTVNSAWQQHRLNREAQEILNIGKEMMERIKTLFKHYDKLGRGLDQAIQAYNQSVGSFKHRVAPKGREFAKLVAGDEDAFPQANQVKKESVLATHYAESDEVADLAAPVRQTGQSQRSGQQLDLFLPKE